MKIFVKAKPKAREELIKKIDDENFIPLPYRILCGLDDGVKGGSRSFTQGSMPSGKVWGFIVSVKEPPIKGLANQAIEKALAKYFNVPRFQVNIISGHTSRQKIVEIK